MGAIIIVPGFMGSEMDYSEIPRFNLWVNYALLFANRFPDLGLAADGVSPMPGYGQALQAGNPLEDYYGPCKSILTEQAREHDAHVVGWGYDWRLDLNTQGQALAAFISSFVTPDDPCRIVAHSMGGLVARLAWKQLALQGKTNLVARIVCLGTPHLGSYASLRLLTGEDPTLKKLLWLYTGLKFVTPLKFPLSIGKTIVSSPKVLYIYTATSWPSLYWLFPSPSTEAPDRGQGLLYSSLLFPAGWELQEGYKNAVPAMRNGFDNDPLTVPPANVMTCVAGTGYETPGGVPPDWNPAQGRNDLLSDVGDGTVPESLAFLNGTTDYTVQCAHLDMPNQLAADGSLIRWLFETPAPVPIAGPIPPRILWEPPAPVPFGSLYDP